MVWSITRARRGVSRTLFARAGAACVARLVLWLIVSTVCVAYADTEYPPLLETQQAREQHILKLMERYPWLAPTGISGHLPNYVGLQQQWLPQLYGNAQFKSLSQSRPAAISFNVQEVIYEEGEVSVLRPEALKSFREEIGRQLIAHPSFEDERLLTDEIVTRLRVQRESDPRAVVAGLVHCLPQARRAEFFKLGDTEAQLDALERASDLTDDVVGQSFRAEGRLAGRPLTKRFLLQDARESLLRERELISLLRVQLALMAVDEGPREAAEAIREAPEKVFDLADPSNHRHLETLLSRLRSAEPQGKSYADQLFKVLKASERKSERGQITRYRDLFTLQEMPPEIAVYRGVIGGDCSLTASYAFPFSPMERVYFLFDPNGAPIRAYVAGTIVEAGGKQTLYLHDVAGPALNKEMQARILHAMFQARKIIGVEQITLPTVVVRDANAGQEPTQVPELYQLIRDMDRFLIQHELPQNYLDIELRTFLGSLPSSGIEYDSPQGNGVGLVFAPDAQISNGLHVTASSNGHEIEEAEPRTLSQKDAFLRILDLLAGEEHPEHFFEDLGFEREEVQRILRVANNDRRAPLDEYYRELESEFQKYGISWSQKFLRKNARYFIFGHLVAPDATSSTTEGMREKTVQYVIETVQRGRARDVAYALIERQPDFFNGNVQFQEYVSGIPLRGEENVKRVKRLLKAGVELRLIFGDKKRERMTELAGCRNSELLVLAMRWLQKEPGAESSSDLTLFYAQMLDNEKHDSDDASLFAVERLMERRTQEATVIESLLKTVRKDANEQIAYRAAVALLRNGIQDAHALKLIEKHSSNHSISEGLRAEGNAALRGSSGDCTRSLEALRG